MVIKTQSRTLFQAEGMELGSPLSCPYLGKKSTEYKNQHIFLDPLEDGKAQGKVPLQNWRDC